MVEEIISHLIIVHARPGHDETLCLLLKHEHATSVPRFTVMQVVGALGGVESLPQIGRHCSKAVAAEWLLEWHAERGSHPTWLCLDLIETLCRLAEAGHEQMVNGILQGPTNSCPELLLLGFAQVGFYDVTREQS